MASDKAFMYRDFVGRLSRRFQGVLDHIEYVHGFDSGTEFEIAICHILRSALPRKYGVCRGHVVDQRGGEAGDDIIIYDRHLYPTLRLLSQDDYARKEWVPIEAVYAYIEAKHTLDLREIEKGKKDERATVGYACCQLAKVKKMCAARDRVSLQMVTRSLEITDQEVKVGNDWPNYRNPVFGMILSRQVKGHSGKPIESPEEIAKQLSAHGLPRDQVARGLLPDLIIAGPCNLMWPVRRDDEGKTVAVLFQEIGTEVEYQMAPNMAFGAGMCVLFAVLDRIELGRLPWIKMVDEVCS